jgi:hypothetical protein
METRGECRQSSNGVACARPLKKSERMGLRSGSYAVRLSNIKALEAQTHNFGQDLLLS